jgi:hypothetical protein
VERLLSIQQYGLTHLFFGGYEQLVGLGALCLKWGTIWASAFLCVLWIRGGTPHVFERYDAIALGFLIGVICRIAYEGAWRKVVVYPTCLCEMHAKEFQKKHSGSEIKELAITKVGKKRLVLTVHWKGTRRPPLRICGRVQNPDEIVKSLSSFYHVCYECRGAQSEQM